MSETPATCGQKKGKSKCFRPKGHAGKHTSAMGVTWD